jgi:Bax protein
MVGKFVTYALVIYCTGLIALVGLLSHHPWPKESPLSTGKPPTSLPAPDFKAIADTSARKAAFFTYLLPLVEWENQRLAAQREQLLTLQTKIANGRELSVRETEQLADWARIYEVDPAPLPELIERLDRRINGLPPALVLAQAAAESAWGTSRFAREGHNYFGQWCFSAGCGLVPKRRRPGAIHEVVQFDSPAASVAAYFHNINTHSAYHTLRVKRQVSARNREPPSAHELVAHLASYSERGEAYIEELRAIMQTNALEPGDPNTTSETASAHSS